MNRVCDECLWSNREHAEWCQSRGYASVGPHPSAPDAEPPAPPGDLEMCCGGTCVRSLCFIHSTEPRTSPCEVNVTVDLEMGELMAAAPLQATYEPGDLVLSINGFTFTPDVAKYCEPSKFAAAGPKFDFMQRRTPCGHYLQTFRDGKLVDEEPIEAYGIAVHLPPDRAALLQQVRDLESLMQRAVFVSMQADPFEGHITGQHSICPCQACKGRRSL